MIEYLGNHRKLMYVVLAWVWVGLYIWSITAANVIAMLTVIMVPAITFVVLHLEKHKDTAMPIRSNTESSRANEKRKDQPVHELLARIDHNLNDLRSRSATEHSELLHTLDETIELHKSVRSHLQD